MSADAPPPSPPPVSAHRCAVCGAPAPGDHVGLLYRGQRWYFCAQPHRLAFKREPERWSAAHPDAAVPVAGPAALPRTRAASVFNVRGATKGEREG